MLRETSDFLPPETHKWMWRVSGGMQFYFARDLLTFPKSKTLRMV